MTDWLIKLFPDWPEWARFWSTLEFGREARVWWIAGFLLLFLSATWLYRRDTRALHPFWKMWLWGLRIGVLAALLVIALGPQERKSEFKASPSQVVILADTSVSMSRQDKDLAAPGASASKSVPSRSELVRQLLENSPLLGELRKTHDVHIETFDSQLVRHQLLRKTATAPATNAAAGSTAAPTQAAKPPDWSEILRPRGVETRLGEALQTVIREEAGETLSGVVVLTDGGNNAGIDPLSVADAAVTQKVRLIPVGVGSTKRPVTLQLAEIQAPTHVHINDGFTITAFVTGQGMARQPLTIELLSKAETDEGEPAVIQSKEEQLLEDGVPISVPFEYVPTEAGRRVFRIRVRPVNKVAALVDEVVQDEISAEVVDRKTRVLLIAGGPMRDYQLVRNLVHRDKTIDIDVLLQTGVPGISQDADKVIFQFPETKEELFAYDVIVAFDPDWKKIRGETGQSLDLLSDWVFSQAGGLMLVAGEVNTPALATASDAVKQEMAKLLELYPV
ncbi:MAG TPA: VWA domain-containing protein, partial [Planctomycetaceae bacterium]